MRKSRVMAIELPDRALFDFHSSARLGYFGDRMGVFLRFGKSGDMRS